MTDLSESKLHVAGFTWGCQRSSFFAHFDQPSLEQCRSDPVSQRWPWTLAQSSSYLSVSVSLWCAGMSSSVSGLRNSFELWHLPQEWWGRFWPICPLLRAVDSLRMPTTASTVGGFAVSAWARADSNNFICVSSNSVSMSCGYVSEMTNF